MLCMSLTLFRSETFSHEKVEPSQTSRYQTTNFRPVDVLVVCGYVSHKEQAGHSSLPLLVWASPVPRDSPTQTK